MEKRDGRISPSKRRFLTERQLARRWNMSMRTLQKHRCLSVGCDYHKFEDGRVRYRLRDIVEYERSARRVVQSEADFSAKLAGDHSPVKGSSAQ